MKAVAAFFFAILLVAAIAYAEETPLGGVLVGYPDGGGSNNFTAVLYPDGGPPAFAIPSGAKVSLQCALPACYQACSTGSSCVTTCTPGSAQTGVQLFPLALFDIQLKSGRNAIAVAPVAPNPDGGLVYCQPFADYP